MESLALATFGNHIGATVELADLDTSLTAQLGGFIFTSAEEIADAVKIGKTSADFTLTVNGVALSGETLLAAFEGTLEEVYPTEFEQSQVIEDVPAVASDAVTKASEKVAEPLVYIPVFPGTNSEYDSAKAFEQAGAKVNLVPFVTLDEAAIEASVDTMVDNIAKANIIFFAGGFSAADEPDGSAKFIVNILLNQKFVRLLTVLSKKVGLSLVSVMDSKPWLNQDCFHTVTLKMPQKQVQPCSTTMLTNTWRKWLKHVSPTQIHHGLLVLKWEISTLFQYHTVKGNSLSMLLNLKNSVITVKSLANTLISTVNQAWILNTIQMVLSTLLKVLQVKMVKSLVKWDTQNVTKMVFSKIFQETRTNTYSVAPLSILQKVRPC